MSQESEPDLPEGQVCPNPECHIDQRFKGFCGLACPECATRLVVACSECDSGAVEEVAGSPYCSDHVPELVSDGGQETADKLAALERGDHVDLILSNQEKPVTAFVRGLSIDQDGLAGIAERTVTLQTFSDKTVHAVLQIHSRPDATVGLSHAVIADEPEDREYVRIEAVQESDQQTLAR